MNRRSLECLKESENGTNQQQFRNRIIMSECDKITGNEKWNWNNNPHGPVFIHHYNV